MKPARILIVEDEMVVSLDIQDRLVALGYEVTGVVDCGEDALAQAEASRPDLVLMDIRLKGAMDGIQAAELLRQRQGLPVVYLTAYSEDTTIQRAKVTEPFGYIIKPFEDREMKSVIEMALYKHQADQRLRESERRYATTLRSIGDGVIATDPQGRVTFLNPVAETLTGWLLAEAQGKPLPEVFRIINELTRQPVEDPVARVLRENTVVSLANHTLLISRQGREIPIDDGAAPILDDHGAITGTVLVFQDVTERRQREAQLRASEERNRRIVETAHEGIWCIDPDSRTSYVNHRMEEMLGYRSDEMVGRPLTDFLRPEDAADHAIQIAARRDGKPGHFERRYRHASNEWRWMSVSATSQFDEQSRFLGSFAMFTDVTERKRMEEEKEKMQAQLLQAQKMESVGQLAGGVAHDFNNLLTVIQGNVHLALEQAPKDSQLYDDLQEIQKAAQRSADLTRQLLAFARKQMVHPSILDLNEMISGLLKMLQRLISESIQLTWLPGSDLWPVKMDPSQIDQILVNLTVNARDAIGGVGKITIQTANLTLDDTYTRTHAECVPGDYVMLAVSDTGAGMDTETKNHLFEPFFTTKPTREGTGLGLATVYGIVKQNGALINVYSEPGQGATFKIYLPRAHAPVHTAEPSVEARSLRGVETVLLVEDEPQILILARRILVEHGYTVLAAHLPEAALSLVAQHPGAIHLLVTDIVMPGMNGRDLWERVAALKPGLRCLFMSGYTANVIAHQGVLEADIHFVQKPFTIETLTRKVREVLEG